MFSKGELVSNTWLLEAEAEAEELDLVVETLAGEEQEAGDVAQQILLQLVRSR
jgi:hypothetical protein